MRPLTVERLLWTCALLAAILFVVVVIALKLGAVPVSLYGLGKDLIRVALHRRSRAIRRMMRTCCASFSGRAAKSPAITA